MTASEAPRRPQGARQSPADWTWGLIRRVHLGIRRPANWAQLFQFGVVGAAGYVINLAVFAVLTLTFDFQHITAAVVAFCVAVTNNFVLNRIWTFRESAEGAHRLSGDPLLHRQSRRPGRQPRGPGARGRCLRSPRPPRPGGGGGGRHAVQLHRQQALDVRLDL